MAGGVEVATNSREADYDTSFMAYHVYKAMSWILHAAPVRRSLVRDFPITVCFLLMAHLNMLPMITV